MAIVADDIPAPLDDIGGEIRQLRRSRGVTVQQLAARIGRSVGHISKVERGLAKPSLKDLYAISVALKVQIGWFLGEKEPIAPNERGIIVRRGSRRKHEQGGIITEALSPNLGEEVELMRSIFEPGAATERKVSVHKGREAGVILSGQLEMWIDGQEFLLEEGDSYSYLSTVEHYSRNPGPGRTVLIWVVTPAGPNAK
jgi:transcriptional regulator with XRE-family HTH domain